MRLIDANELEARLRMQPNNLSKISVIDMVHASPTIEERKTGRWIHLLDGSGNVECTECGVEQPVDSYYCPFCGAKMEMRYLK